MTEDKRRTTKDEGRKTEDEGQGNTGLVINHVSVIASEAKQSHSWSDIASAHKPRLAMTLKAQGLCQLCREME